MTMLNVCVGAMPVIYAVMKAVTFIVLIIPIFRLLLKLGDGGD